METILTGHVFDSDNKPAPGAELSGVACGGHLESTVTDSDGYFIFKGVMPGDGYVRASLRGHLGEVHDFTIEEGKISRWNSTLRKPYTKSMAQSQTKRESQ